MADIGIGTWPETACHRISIRPAVWPRCVEQPVRIRQPHYRQYRWHMGGLDHSQRAFLQLCPRWHQAAIYVCRARPCEPGLQPHKQGHQHHHIDIDKTGWHCAEPPSTSIGYVSNPNNDSLIATINNGYGAVATYGYFEGNQALATGGVRRYHYVNSRTVADGTSNSAVEEFAFTGACFSDKQPTLQPCYTGHDDLFPEAQGSLIGF